MNRYGLLWIVRFESSFVPMSHVSWRSPVTRLPPFLVTSSYRFRILNLSDFWLSFQWRFQLFNVLLPFSNRVIVLMTNVLLGWCEIFLSKSLNFGYLSLPWLLFFFSLAVALSHSRAHSLNVAFSACSFFLMTHVPIFVPQWSLLNCSSSLSESFFSCENLLSDHFENFFILSLSLSFTFESSLHLPYLLHPFFLLHHLYLLCPTVQHYRSDRACWSCKDDLGPKGNG